MFLLNLVFLAAVILFNTEESTCAESWMYAEEENKTCECGISPLLTEYIINGDEVKYMKTYPWLITLHDKRKTDAAAWGYCGGALISQDTVLTASHCVFVEKECPTGKARCEISPENLEIGLIGPSFSEPARKVKVKKIVSHPLFSLQHLHNDVSLIKLSESVPCTEYSRPICISDEDIATENITLRIAGWGRMKSFKRSSVLRDGKTRVVSESRCSIFGSNPSETICTFGKTQQACHGDSGSPAIIRISDRYFAVGVTSGGVPNCIQGFGAFYTKIAAYYEFIKENMESD